MHVDGHINSNTKLNAFNEKIRFKKQVQRPKIYLIERHKKKKKK